MPAVLKAAISYVAAVFGVGFVLGTVRVLVLVPRWGELAAVAAETPLMLAASWVVARAVLRRWPLPPGRERLLMGVIALALLIALEFALSVAAFGRPAAEFFDKLATAPGALGLAMQMVFGLIPWLQGRRRVQP
jgi:hypothetical protein